MALCILKIGVMDGVLEYLSGVEPWRETLDWNRKITSGNKICPGANGNHCKCATNA